MAKGVTPKTTKGLPVGRHGVGSIGAGVFGLGLDTYFNLREGDSVPKAIGKGLISGAAWAIAEGPMMAATFGVPLMVGGAQWANNFMAQSRQDYNQSTIPGTNFTYRDSRAALTMRQAAVQAIQGSKLNARNALGGEAALMHRGYQR
jgi:hypothetical protein